jgi:hypothetical protein
MKNYIAAIGMFIATTVNAQINLEHIYPNGSPTFGEPLRVVHLSAGYKYCYIVPKGSNSGIINLYNLNHTLYKSITIPPLFNGFYSSDPPSIYYISDSLFNTTTSDIEYLVLYQDSTSVVHIVVFNDSGNKLFSQDSVSLTISDPSWPYAEPVFYTPNGYKMIISSTVYGDSVAAYVYSLPGALPCSECSNGVLTGIENPLHNGNSGYLSSPYPNPNSHSTSIKYQLPEGISTGQLIFYDLSGREIKRYTVDRAFNTLELSTTDLASGTYLYILQTSGSNIGNRKMVVIK